MAQTGGMSKDRKWSAWEVPANASRFMATADEARDEPSALLELAWHEADPYLFNSAFDPSVIRHDDSYCTSVVDLDGVAQVPTLAYLEDRVLPYVRPDAQVIDIGCGRGEFVTELRSHGIDAIGFDPVLPAEAPHLQPRYWTPAEAGGDLFVMRCVLPHIPSPWIWTAAMGAAHPDALLLVEYQRLEWMIDEGVWYQLCHDHVNQFTAGDFHARFDVVDEGTFHNGEWGWSLLRPATYRPADPAPCRVAVDTLLRQRARDLQAAQGPVVPWGAAGKGIVLAHALLGAGVDVPFAIDADPLRQGMHMEVSGVPILGPGAGLDRLPDHATVWICNPNHRSSIETLLGSRGQSGRSESPRNI